MDDATPVASYRNSARRRLHIAALVAIAALGAASSWAAPPQPPVVTNISPAFGSVLGGTAVTFVGSNFQPPMIVYFGGTPATNCTTPGIQFTCNVPPAATEGPVTVTVKNHTGNTSVDIPNGYLYVCASCTVSPVSMQIEGKGPGGTTEPNGILEPGETNVSFAPTWFNASSGALASHALTGFLSQLSSDSSYMFTAPGDVASYDAIDSGGSGTCNACYSLSFSFTGARPSPHVDVTVVEAPSIAGDAASDGSDARQWTIHIGKSFTDEPASDVFYVFIENLLHNGLTAGCPDTPGGFCPGQNVIRAQMAIFLARGIAGGDANVPDSGTVNSIAYDCVNGPSLFGDVPVGSVFCKHIHYIANLNVTQGCGGGNFCPDQQATRQEMAAFVARALLQPGGEALVPNSYGPDPITGLSYDCTAVTGTPPGPNGGFPDVTLGSQFCSDIGYIWARGVVDGFPDGTYGPDLPTTRGQMAKFLVNAFRLSLRKPRAVQPDFRLAGNSISIRPLSFQASASGTFTLPSGKDAPTFGGATLRVFDTGLDHDAWNFPGTGGAQIMPLPAAQWAMQSTASGPMFVYTGLSNSDEACTSVTLDPAGQITADCFAGNLQTPFSGDAALILDTGSSRFCATWQGTTVGNDSRGLKRIDSPAPLRCPAVQAAPQSVQVTQPIFSNGLTVYQLFPLNGASGPNRDALTITQVTQPLVTLFNTGDGLINGASLAGCYYRLPCTQQVGVVSIAPDGRSLVYDLNPGEPPVPDPLSNHNNDPLGPMCQLATVDPGNTATIETPANPSLHCVASDDRLSLFGLPVSTAYCPDSDDRINYWPFRLQFTISDGVTESTQTMVLTMFSHKCIPQPPIPPPFLVIMPPPPPDPQAPPPDPRAPPPPPLLAFGPADTNPPTAPLNTNLPPISLGPVTSAMLPSGSGGSFTVAANCPVIPNVPSPICTGTGSFSIDSGSPLLQSSNGGNIQLNQPLTVTGYSHTNIFAAVTISAASGAFVDDQHYVPGSCPFTTCYLQSSSAVLFNVTNTCSYRDQNGIGWDVDCSTGQVIGGPHPI